MNVWLFSIGILLFLLTVYGTVMIGGYQLRMARLEQQREEDRHAASDESDPADAPSWRR